MVLYDPLKRIFMKIYISQKIIKRTRLFYKIDRETSSMFLVDLFTVDTYF